MYKKVLIATDGSELAGHAVEHGLQLAKSVDAEVVILTVTEALSSLHLAGEGAFGDLKSIEEYQDAYAKSAHEILNLAAEHAALVGVRSEVRHVSDRKPATGILETAESENCDLIVMASHGRRGLQSMLIGSQTSAVIAESTRPVLVCQRRSKSAPFAGAIVHHLVFFGRSKSTPLFRI